jgi:hypothetical protein
MNGLLEQPQKTIPGGMPSKPTPEQSAENPAPNVAVDPKLQEQMDIITANGIRMIHSQKLSASLIKSITSAEDPVDAIADSTVAVIDRLESSAKQKNMAPDFGVLAQSANVLMGEIIQIAEIAGMELLSDEDKYRAYSLAVSKYIDDAMKSGKISNEQLLEMAEQAKQTPEGQKIMQAVEPGPTPEATAPEVKAPETTAAPRPGLLQGRV